MASNLEARIIQLELRAQLTQRALDQARQRIDQLTQTARTPGGSPSGGGGGGGSGVFVARTGAGGIAAASAAPAGGTPGSATCAIYLIYGGAYFSMGSRMVLNPMLSATAASAKVLVCHSNGDGTFTLSSESCT